MEERVPQYLSSPIKILFFEPDEFGVIVATITLSLVFGGLFWFSIIILPLLYIRVKRKYPSSFLKHMVYMIGIKELNHYPSTFESEFQE